MKQIQKLFWDIGSRLGDARFNLFETRENSFDEFFGNRITFDFGFDICEFFPDFFKIKTKNLLDFDPFKQIILEKSLLEEKIEKFLPRFP